MKRISFVIIALIVLFAFNSNVSAASANLSVSSSSVYVGDTFTVSANVYSAAAWNIHVSSSGPVSGCAINQADATADAMDANKTFRVTCTATGTGTITISMSGDVTSASDGNAVDVSGSRSVTVTQRPTQPSNNTNSNKGNKTTNNNTNSVSTDNKSTNNNVKELSVDGYELVKVDNNNYTLSVSNDVTNVNVNVVTEDNKASVAGAGSHDLVVGENNIEVVVTAESGLQNKINIKVTRKDGYYLEDLDSVLIKDDLGDINIKVNSDTVINSSDLEKIKNSSKIVNLNCYNENNNLMYSWIIDGSKLNNTSSFATSLSYDSESKKDMLRLSNYADGLFVSLKQTDNLPMGLKLKLYVGSKYDNNDEVNVYSYVNGDEQFNLVASKLKVQDGYVTFDVVEASDYMVTMSTLMSNEVVASNDRANLSTIIICVLTVVLVVMAIIIFVLIRKISQIRKNSQSKEPEANNLSYSIPRDSYENLVNTASRHDNEEREKLNQVNNSSNLSTLDSNVINFDDFDNHS